MTKPVVGGIVCSNMIPLFARLHTLTKRPPKARQGRPAARLYIITDDSGRLVASK
jgi:hypothetical protein